MRIRAARRDDFEAVTRLLEVLGRPRTLGESSEEERRVIYEDQVVEPDTHHIVAEDDAGIVGFCSLHFRSRLNWESQEAWIPDLVVLEGARRTGVGRALLEEAERRARERGCHALTLESGYQRAEAHHLYRTFRMRDFGKSFVKDLRPRPQRR
jgi:GNAT superfamily N-acetyltransferase